MDIDQFCKRLEHYRDACNSIDRARQMLDSINFESEGDDERIKSLCLPNNLVHFGFR